MQKIPTLFKRDPDNPKYVTREVNPECQWVLDGEGVATRKFDGTCVRLDNDGKWWARREVKKGKTPPADFVEVEHDPNTGKTVGWEPVEQSSFAKYHTEAVQRHVHDLTPGTYELVGPKVNGNPEGLDYHALVSHGAFEMASAEWWTEPRTFDDLEEWLQACAWEGIVWHHPDGRMAKLKRRDFPKAEA